MISAQRILLWHHLKMLQGYELALDPEGDMTFMIDVNPLHQVKVGGPLNLNRPDIGYTLIPGEVVEQILLPRIEYLNALSLPSYAPNFAPVRKIAFYYLFALNKLLLEIRAEYQRSER
ncbi:hypothetical protein [Ruegeria sp.]|uniref:hypothetical protein n=1 Tax=Ruegeria sp. TaxID=1879320 RepID=UPI003C7E02AC